LQESSDYQPFLQGLIQAAVSFHHYQHGKWGAARAMLIRSQEKLSRYPTNYNGINLADLLTHLKEWETSLSKAIIGKRPHRLPLEYPKIKFIKPESRD